MSTRTAFVGAAAVVALLSGALPAAAVPAPIDQVSCDTAGAVRLTGEFGREACYAGLGQSWANLPGAIHISAGQWGGWVSGNDGGGEPVPAVYFHPGDELDIQIYTLDTIQIDEQA